MATVNTPRGSAYTTRPDVDVVANTTVLPSRLSRVSWGAILAGLVISLVGIIGFNMLGLSIGASSINPATEVNPVEPAFGTGAAIWILASNILALFLGGVVAGRLAGVPDSIDGMLHGLVTWGVALLVTILLLTTTLGNIISGVTSAVGNTLSAVGQGVSAVSPAVADALELQTLSVSDVNTQIRDLLNNANAAATEGTEGTTGTETTAATDDTVTTADVQEAQTLIEAQLRQAFSTLLSGEEITPEQTQQFVTQLSEATGISEEEARTTVEEWQTQVAQFRDQAEETAREVGQQVADGVAALAGLVFASMVVAAFAAGAGGVIGSPDRLPEDEIVRTTTVN